MTSQPGARARARDALTASIKEEARRELAAEGASRLSLRAVSRALGMASSALYRYFPSRDDLLTALIIDAYDALGEAAETALDRAASAGEPPLARWRAICRAVRAWALANPHEYALLYGSPVPGYAAPQSTTGPAARVGLALLAVVAEAHAAGGPDGAGGEPPEAPPDAGFGALADRLGVRLPPTVMRRAVAAWAQLFGLVGFELFGQFEQTVEDREAFFDTAADDLGRTVGLR